MSVPENIREITPRGLEVALHFQLYDPNISIFLEGGPRWALIDGYGLTVDVGFPAAKASTEWAKRPFCNCTPIPSSKEISPIPKFHRNKLCPVWFAD